MHEAAALTRAAIEAAGGPAEVARALGINRQAVYQWKLIPPRRVAAVVRMTGGRFTFSQLRPDVYPSDQP